MNTNTQIFASSLWFFYYARLWRRGRDDFIKAGEIEIDYYFSRRVVMDELDEFLDSLETGPSDTPGVTSGDIDLEAEIDDLFKSDGATRPEGEAIDDDSDDEFTLEGVSSNLQRLSLQNLPIIRRI